MESKMIGPWVMVDGHAAMRCLAGSDGSVIANRVAFIEKTPRVRVAPGEEQGSWMQGPKGCAPEYGSHQPSRDWCDARLRELGYTDKPTVECKACGTIYALATAMKLGGRFIRNPKRGKDGILRSWNGVTCPCGNHVITEEHAHENRVAATSRSRESFSTDRMWILRPLRRTEKRIFFGFEIGNTEAVYNLSNGAEIGGRGRIDQAELDRAIAILAKKPA